MSTKNATTTTTTTANTTSTAGLPCRPRQDFIAPTRENYNKSAFRLILQEWFERWIKFVQTFAQVANSTDLLSGSIRIRNTPIPAVPSFTDAQLAELRRVYDNRGFQMYFPMLDLEPHPSGLKTNDKLTDVEWELLLGYTLKSVAGAQAIVDQVAYIGLTFPDVQVSRNWTTWKGEYKKPGTEPDPFVDVFPRTVPPIERPIENPFF